MYSTLKRIAEYRLGRTGCIITGIFLGCTSFVYGCWLAVNCGRVDAARADITKMATITEEKRREVLINREAKRLLETNVSETLPAEIPSEDSRLETIRNQFQQLKQQYENLGQGLNELEKSLYQK